MIKKLLCTILASAAIMLPSAQLYAEEGMWTFDNIPSKQLQEKYNFTPGQEWLDKVRLASIRFGDGGSGSFISSTGLALTNHHVALRQLQKMSSKEKDYVKDGFYAPTKNLEIKCTDLELNVLVAMENVTERIKNAAENQSKELYTKTIKAEIAKIEKENTDKTGMKSQVVTLYHGGEYWLYTYKKYRDVRLVMAPEKQVASFGGKWDNFTYPRYDLDFAIFRVYENDKPINSENFFKINPRGAGENELIFVSGHPGTTRRGISYSHFLFNRDYAYPANIKRIDTNLDYLYAYAQKGPEEKRRATSSISSFENTKKAVTGEYAALKDKSFALRFEANEKKFRDKAAANSKIKTEVNDSFNGIDKALSVYSKKYKEIYFSPFGKSMVQKANRMPSIAKEIVKYCIEIKKTDAERMNGYHDSQIDRFMYEILSTEPIYKDLEEALLSASFRLSLDALGSENKAVQSVMAGQTPEARAKELISKSSLDDVTYRKKLLEGGLEALKNSDDPLIQMALKTEETDQSNYEWHNKNVESILTPATEKIARAKFAIYGKEIYPDATFTLRLTYGKSTPYNYNGTLAPAFTTMYGMYDRYHSFKNSEYSDWDLPKKYIEIEKNIDLSTPVNFVYETDTIGGNSGSPVFNKKLELVGVNFDRNTEGLVRQFIYDGTSARSVGVHSGVIIETLKKIYNADALVKELTGE